MSTVQRSWHRLLREAPEPALPPRRCLAPQLLEHSRARPRATTRRDGAWRRAARTERQHPLDPTAARSCCSQPRGRHRPHLAWAHLCSGADRTTEAGEVSRSRVVDWPSELEAHSAECHAFGPVPQPLRVDAEDPPPGRWSGPRPLRTTNQRVIEPRRSTCCETSSRAADGGPACFVHEHFKS